MNRVCSIFSQLLQLFSRLEFQRAVKDHKAERHMRGFTSWGQFVAMLFCQLGRAHTLREICGGLASCEGKLKHLGIPRAPKRSTLAYANEHRPWQLYQTLFQQLLGKCQAALAGKGGRKKFRFKNKLVSLDSSVVDLSLSFILPLGQKGFLALAPQIPERGHQRIGNIHLPDLARFREIDFAAHNAAPHDQEFAILIEIAPLYPCQFTRAQPGVDGTKENCMMLG